MNDEKKGKVPASAEELNDYVHVASPSIWMILAAVGILTAGLVLWSFTATLRTIVNAVALSYEETGTAIVFSAESGEDVKTGNKVIIADQEYVIQSLQDQTVSAADILTRYEYNLIHADADTQVYIGTLSGTLEEGSYNAEIVTEESRPIDFLFRRGAE